MAVRNAPRSQIRARQLALIRTPGPQSCDLGDGDTQRPKALEQTYGGTAICSALVRQDFQTERFCLKTERKFKTSLLRKFEFLLLLMFNYEFLILLVLSSNGVLTKLLFLVFFQLCSLSSLGLTPPHSPVLQEQTPGELQRILLETYIGDTSTAAVTTYVGLWCPVHVHLECVLF